jgi:hypothetical protein
VRERRHEHVHGIGDACVAQSIDAVEDMLDAMATRHALGARAHGVAERRHAHRRNGAQRDEVHLRDEAASDQRDASFR